MKTTTVNASELSVFWTRSPEFFTKVDQEFRDKARTMWPDKRTKYVWNMPGWFIDYINKQLGMKLSYGDKLPLVAAALAFKKQYVKQLHIELQLMTEEKNMLLDSMAKLWRLSSTTS